MIQRMFTRSRRVRIVNWKIGFKKRSKPKIMAVICNLDYSIVSKIKAENFNIQTSNSFEFMKRLSVYTEDSLNF